MSWDRIESLVIRHSYIHLQVHFRKCYNIKHKCRWRRVHLFTDPWTCWTSSNIAGLTPWLLVQLQILLLVLWRDSKAKSQPQMQYQLLKVRLNRLATCQTNNFNDRLIKRGLASLYLFQFQDFCSISIYYWNSLIDYSVTIVGMLFIFQYCYHSGEPLKHVSISFLSSPVYTQSMCCLVLSWGWATLQCGEYTV